VRLCNPNGETPWYVQTFFQGFECAPSRCDIGNYHIRNRNCQYSPGYCCYCDYGTAAQPVRQGRGELVCEEDKGCFHASTEFVTPAGVKTAAQLVVGDEIRVWNPATNTASFSPMIAWWIRPSDDAQCDSSDSQTQFVRVNYTTVSGLSAAFTVTRYHNVEIACRPGEIRNATDGEPLRPDHCLVDASSVVIGDRLAIWDEMSSSVHAANVSTVEAFTGGSMYTPLTELGMNFVLSGGVLIPMDGKAYTLPGSLSTRSNTIPRTQVAAMLSFGLQYYTAVRLLMPASFVAALLATEDSVVFGPCIQTPHVSNAMLLAINTSSSLSDALSRVGNQAGLVSWAASNLCSALPGFCSNSSEQSVAISQSAQQASLAELSIDHGGRSVHLHPLQDPYVWLNELEGAGGLDAGTIAGIAVGSAIGLLLCIAGAAFWKRKSKVIAQTKVINHR